MVQRTMRAVQVHQYGDFDELKLEQIPVPEPGAGEVLVRVHAVGVLPADNARREGFFSNTRFSLPFPFIPGTALSGVVEAVGAGVTDFQPGQAVFGRASKGALAEYVTPAAENLALKPDEVSFEAAATVSGGATTAWITLFDNAHLEAGQRVLVHAAAGGVGLFAIQFARWRGAQVYGTASTANVEYVRSLGAEAIEYTTTRFEDVAQDVDVVLDALGGDVQRRSMTVIKPGGILVSIYEEPSQDEARRYGIRAKMNEATFPYPSTQLLQTIGALMASGAVKTHVAREYSLDDVRQAHEQVATGHGRGRVIIKLVD